MQLSLGRIDLLYVKYFGVYVESWSARERTLYNR